MADELGICTRCHRYGLLMAPHWVCVLCRVRGPRAEGQGRYCSCTQERGPERSCLVHGPGFAFRDAS